ncbi:DnaJ subfamily B member like [Heracleum sosnowskyi]|uniref:DnaJ subfamily B member like n=1 Tax=Heracleum sosnowskyi TaxID=360622 RepID=A0AAD8JBQ6_9APIA|nr:DnaJ subfamily B member like [Heracleum sosnowskyi]
MECNKDEADRAKAIAEKKLEDRDFAGAKKFALKAQTLYPSLEGLPQILTTLDVYIAAENKISGEMDWYGVLGVTPSSDDETIKKQYRKLALMLHPDKNKSVGADGAFKLLSEAWGLLSDKVKRLAYNQRRSINGFQQRVPSQTGRPSAAPSGNGSHNVTNRVPHPKPKTHKNTVVPPTSRRTDTFWTICNQCKMHYEYLKMYLNHTLLCPNCQQAFLAAEVAPPDNFPKSSSPSSEQTYQNKIKQPSNGKPGTNTTSTPNVRQGCSAGVNLHKHSNPHRGTHSNVVRTGKAEPSVALKAGNVVQQANEKLKRAREESQGFGFKEEMPSKRRVVDGNGQQNREKAPFQTSRSAGAGNFSGLHGFSGINSRPNGTRELTLLETRNMLIEKAQKEIKKKLSEWTVEAAKKAEEKRKVEQTKKEKLKNGTKFDDKLNGESSLSKDKNAEHLISTSADGDNENDVAQSMDVPDPDFHDFDMDRTESSFGDGQTWAAYDDDDGMPRYYAFIHKVISRKPFKMRISWLNSRTNSEFGPMEWVGCGFSKSCGEFRVGKYEINKSLNSFSHKAKWTKGTRGVLQILPQKGDIWALYRNWSTDWNEHTPDEVIHKYDMVEVHDDYSEEQGVFVTPLVKVAGFRTVFHPHRDCDKVMRICKEEMFRFSHRIPHYTLTGQEAENAPKGYLELDPAATPLEFLQVLTKIDGEPATEKHAAVEEEKQRCG